MRIFQVDKLLIRALFNLLSRHLTLKPPLFHDPELYTPDSYEGEIGGFTRFLHKYFYEPWEVEAKCHAFNLIRNHNKMVMYQTTRDVWCMQQIEGMGNMGNTSYLASNQPVMMQLQQYVRDEGIKSE